jgi:hypothetical protein
MIYKTLNRKLKIEQHNICYSCRGMSNRIVLLFRHIYMLATKHVEGCSEGHVIVKMRFFLFWFLVFNATFNNSSSLSWRPVLVVDKVGVPVENHRPWASNW